MTTQPDPSGEDADRCHDAWFGMTPDDALAWARGDQALVDLHEASIHRELWTYIRYRLPARKGWGTGPSDADAHDLTQVVRLAIFEQYDGTTPLRPWALTVACRASIDVHRRHASKSRREDAYGREDAYRRSLLEEGLGDEDELGAGEVDEAMAEWRAAVDRATEALTPRQREVYEAWLAHDGDYKLVADVLGRNPATVASNLTRAWATLRGALEADGYRAVPRGTALPRLARVVFLCQHIMIVNVPGDRA